jgi:hypothetical protein
MPIQLVFWNHLNRAAQQGLQLPGNTNHHQPINRALLALILCNHL